MSDYIDDLRATVDRAATTLAAVKPEAAERRPATGGWSPKQILGHLIDSAAVNHQRFVRAQWQDLIFASYAQEDWVNVQQYQLAPWAELVALWVVYNRHLARVMAAVPAEVRSREQRRHNLHEIAWKPVPAEQPTTLSYLMWDYVEHLKHHLRQIETRLAAKR